MTYTLKDKIETLGDMADRMEILSNLLIEEDIDSSDHASKNANILNEIRNEYKEKYRTTYDREYEDE